MNQDKSLTRIAKVMARRGTCSRREAEKLILSGHVTVDGVKITNVAEHVAENANISVCGEAIPQKDVTRIWKYYKPKGFVTTHSDPEGRPTIFEDIKDRYPKLPYLTSVGRLDYNSEGLLLLTNDGHLVHELSIPKNQVERLYKVRVFGTIPSNMVKDLAKGVTIDGVRYGSVVVEECESESSTSSMEGAHEKRNQWLLVKLYEGKNREIRKLMEHFGLQVSRLIRLSFGPYILGSMKPHELIEDKIRNLRHTKNTSTFSE